MAVRKSRSRRIDTGRYDAIVADIRLRAGRITEARSAIITTLLGSNGHVTAEELAAQIHRQLPDVHLSTVYRTLDTLEEIGVVEHVHLGHGRAVYHLADEFHHHLVCDNCDKVVEVPDSVFNDVGVTLAATYGFTIRPHHFAVAGLCRVCSARP